MTRRPAGGRVVVGEGLGRWLRRDRKGRLRMAQGRHDGELLAGVPEGYMRAILTKARLPPLVRLHVLEAIGEVECPPAPSSSDGWVPFLMGDISGYVQQDVARLFLAEYHRLSTILGTDRPTPVLEAMVALSSTTPSDSLR